MNLSFDQRLHAKALKQELFRLGVEVCRDFLDTNCLRHPEFIGHKAPHTNNKWQDFGLYVAPRVYVNVEKSSMPAYFRGRMWSWPGYKTDRTATGITAHECGHHLVELIRNHELFPSKLSDRLLERFMPAIEGEKDLTGYAPVPEEHFAEAARLYILNPDLLKHGRPKRYAFFHDGLELNPIGGPWRDMLQGAPGHIIEAAARFAKEQP